MVAAAVAPSVGERRAVHGAADARLRPRVRRPVHEPQPLDLLHARRVLGGPGRLAPAVGLGALALRSAGGRRRTAAEPRPDAVGRSRCSRASCVFFLVLVAFYANPFATLAGGAARRPGAQPAAAELRAVDPPDRRCTSGFVGFTRAVRVRDRRARSPGDLGDGGSDGAPVDALVVDPADRRHPVRRALGLRRARLGRLLGLGPGREREPAALAHRARRTCTRSVVQEKRGIMKVWNVSLLRGHVRAVRSSARS